MTRLVIVAATIGFGLRLWLASTTFGTNDVRYWMEFAEVMQQVGPIAVYAHEGFTAQFNHPPLASVYVWAISHVGIETAAFRLALRAPACAADVGTVWLVYSLLRERTSLGTAAAVAAGLALSPVAIIVSGFHGNTDPVFVFLLLAGVAVLRTGHHARAGVLVAIALSIKIIPIIVVPALAVAAWRSGRPAAGRFALGASVAAIAVWAPALVLQPTRVLSQVVGYRGIGFTEWGLPQFARLMGFDAVASAYITHAGTVVALACAVVALVLALRGDPIRAVAVSMVLFLVLAPAFAMQYLVWPLAFALVLHPRIGSAYNAAASVLALSVYSHWSDGWPGTWYEARATPFLYVDLPLMALAWLCLAGLLTDVAVRRTTPPTMPERTGPAANLVR